ncbi:MAG TPA: signal peptidase II [Gemmatimonadales bacterium]|nr:signal peptidase II [Gemmatimonadales bacterium]
MPILLLVVALDQFTKAQAEQRLLPEHAPYPVLGDFLRFTLTHNTGAAMSLSLGDWSRPIFSLVAVLALMLLYRLFAETAAGARWRAAAIALIAGGAIGNLLDRLQSDRGVTDFIDIGLPVWRFWTFNVADIGVTCGALLLALLFWLDDAEPEPRLSTEGGNDGTLR